MEGLSVSGAIAMPLSPAQAAEMCGVGVSVIYRAIGDGSLPARHRRGQTSRWFILREDLEAWAAGGMLEKEAS